VTENIATGTVNAVDLDIHYSKGLVYWNDSVDKKIMRYDIHYNTGLVYLTDVVDKRIMRYDIHYNKGLVYLTDVVDNKIMRYFIAHFTFTHAVPLASSVVDGWFKSRSGQTKNYEIGICCFADKHAAETSNSKVWFVRNEIADKR
jgi:hypothetical protein